jgi:hypothetical protein
LVVLAVVVKDYGFVKLKYLAQGELVKVKVQEKQMQIYS